MFSAPTVPQVGCRRSRVDRLCDGPRRTDPRPQRSRVAAALHAQLDRGTHYGAGHEGEIRWAEQVSELIPSAERVRFTMSGTEANLLAPALARTYTGRNSMLKFEGHFHGWSDYLVKGEKPPFESPDITGVPDEVLRTVAVLPPEDLGAVEERLAQGDIAAILVEPSGASWSSIPLAETFLAELANWRPHTVLC